MYDDHDRNNNVMCKVLKGKKKFIVEIVDSDFFPELMNESHYCL